ncbi:MAG: PEGA domain-containing protein [Myxococcota bacterium]|nr:PEGA domain-containing protein [Myxococcota bacterium]
MRLALVTLLVACGPKPVETGVTRNDAILSIKSNVRDAQVYVDGRFVTPLDAAGGGIAVTPGTHRFELRHEDYFSSYLELTLVKAERKKVSMELAPILP